MFVFANGGRRVRHGELHVIMCSTGTYRQAWLSDACSGRAEDALEASAAYSIRWRRTESLPP